MARHFLTPFCIKFCISLTTESFDVHFPPLKISLTKPFLLGPIRIDSNYSVCLQDIWTSQIKNQSRLWGFLFLSPQVWEKPFYFFHHEVFGQILYFLRFSCSFQELQRCDPGRKTFSSCLDILSPRCQWYLSQLVISIACLPSQICLSCFVFLSLNMVSLLLKPLMVFFALIKIMTPILDFS